MTDLPWQQDASSLVDAFRAGERSPVEELEATLAAKRVELDEAKLRAEIAGLRSVASLPDPLGRVDIHRELDEGLVLTRVSCPVGVIAVIFEARPDAVIQIASLGLKSGNGVILKGGSEALNSCRAIVDAIHRGLNGTAVDPGAVTLLSTREESTALLALDGYVDLVIPRGSNALVQFVQRNTRIPVLGHADGICHLYVDRAADVDMAAAVAVDSKTQYPAACNAIETLLVHRDIAASYLPAAAAALGAKGVTLRVDAASRAILAPSISTVVMVGRISPAIALLPKPMTAGSSGTFRPAFWASTIMPSAR